MNNDIELNLDGLTVDITKPVSEEEFEDAIDLLTQTLLFDTPWKDLLLENPKHRRTIPIITDIPLVCKATDCAYAAKCPIMKALSKDADKLKFIGTECRADKIYAIQQFTSLAKELDVKPEQTNDIISIASIVRLLILKRRIDWSLAIDGIVTKEPGAIDQKSGTVYYKLAAHPLLKVSADIEKQISQVQKQLMADRQERAKLAASLGNRGSDLLKALFTGKVNALPASTPIEAEFIMEEDEDE